MEKATILGEEITSEHYPIMVEKAKADIVATEQMVKSVAEAWHEGSVVSALQALESDLQHS